jgi:hypothetical protein
VKKKQIIRFGIKFILILFLILTGSYFILNEVIRRNITKELRKPYAFAKIDVSDVHVNVLSASVQLDSLKVDFPLFKNNKGNVPHCYIPKTEMKGISLLQFALHNRLIVDIMIVQNAQVTLDSLLLSKKDTILSQIKWPFNKLFIRHAEWENTALTMNAVNGSKVAVIKIQKLMLAGFDFERSPTRKLMVNKIFINNSETNVFNNSGIEKYIKSFDNNGISAYARQLMVNNFVIRSRSAANAINLKGSLNMDDIEINRSQYNDGYHFKAIQCRLSNIDYTLKGGLHAVRIKDIELNSKKESVVLQHIRIVPMLNRENFFRRLGHQADMVEADISKVEIVKIDIPALLQKKLFAEKMLIHSAGVHVFRDRRYPRPGKSIPLPMEAPEEVPLDIRIKVVELNPSTVAYEEQPKEGNQTGTLRIERLKFSISPFVNHFRESGTAYLEMKTEGSLMGTGNVQATMLMPVKPGMPYHVKGVFNRVELTRLNSSSENLGKIRIKSGFLDFLYFQFAMSDKESTGKIIGAYHDLVIQKLKKHTNEKKVEKFSSFMLRNLIIPLNKPASLPERRRTGSFRYKRDPSRFFSYYLLQSLLTGVKASFTLGFLLPK